MTADADRDAIAVIKAALCHDQEGMVAILRNCDPVPMIRCMAEMYSHGTRRQANDPGEQLDRYLAAVYTFVALHEAADRRLQEYRDHIARTEDGQT